MSDRWADEPVPCADPECPEEQPSAQPEADGDLRYYACACGFEFGYEMVARQAGTCQIGVPEDVRRAYSAASLSPPYATAAAPVFLGAIGRRPG